MTRLRTGAAIVFLATASFFSTCADAPVDLRIDQKEKKRDELEREIDSRRGEVTFWLDHDPRCGVVDVRLYGMSDTLGPGDMVAPEGCGGSLSTASFIIAPGDYVFEAQCASYRWTGNVTVENQHCTLTALTQAARIEREDAEPGELMFWVSDALACGDVEVVVDDAVTAYITDDPFLPNCGDEGVANFELPFGLHRWRATCGTNSWDDTVEIESGECHEIELTGAETAEPPFDPNKGQVMFWTPYDLGCLPIRVELAGQVGTMSAVFPDGVPECRAAGTATFDVEQGTYAFVATCGDKRWEDEVYVSAPFCVGIRLE